MDTIFSYIFPAFVISIFVFVIFGIFSKKGRVMSVKLYFWGGEVVKDYGWLDDAGTAINPLVKQRVQVLKYKKADETFHVLMVKDSSVASVQMLPVKLSEQEAQKLVTILSEKN
ncbi:MAG: hypothetical protein RLZZ67_652 [Candidatus Parcubacteria bacterium]|jgi:hypothetical protein